MLSAAERLRRLAPRRTSLLLGLLLATARRHGAEAQLCSGVSDMATPATTVQLDGIWDAPPLPLCAANLTSCTITRSAANLPPHKSDDDSGSSGKVMNATDLRMPTLTNFNLKRPITDAEGIAACSAYCANHSSTCGGWVYVSPAYMPRSHYTGPRCSIKGKGPCYTAPGHPGLFSGALSGSCSLPPPRPPPPGPLPPSPPKPHDPFYSQYHVQAMRHAIYDPDGPAFFNSSSNPEGTYHLFAQYNPTAPRSSAHELGGGAGAYSAMQWYHWTSRDLLRWQHQPIALAPGAKQDCGGIWSGSMTLVRNDTSGEVLPMITYSVPCQRTAPQPPLV